MPGGGLYASSLADYLAAVTNEYAGEALQDAHAYYASYLQDTIGTEGGGRARRPPCRRS